MSDHDWQQEVAAFMRRHDLCHDPTAHVLDLVSEVGELAKVLLLSTDYGRKPCVRDRALQDEFGDLLYSLLATAEVCGLDADDALRHALHKYEGRLARREEAGSG